MKTRIALLSFVMILGSLVLLSMTSAPQAKGKPWTIPANYMAMKNTAKNDAASMTKAKDLWNKYCKSCHGAKGLGDGTKAAGLKTAAGDFSSKEFQSQKDGALYFQTSVGRDEMPGYEKKITDENDRWLLVHYMRTFAK
ncbi:MAG: cytochrome c [Bacteroidota bacterium]